MKTSAFDMVRRQQPNFTENIIAIEGDVAKLKLGMRDDDWNLLTEGVEIMFHVAATTKFNEDLDKATLINVRGTREALSLAKAMKKLRSYVHISTAYSHATEHRIGSEVKEKFYESPMKPEIVISMAENFGTEMLNRISSD